METTTTRTKKAVKVTLFGGWFSVRAEYNPRLVAGLKGLGGKWDAQDRRWLVNQSRCASLYTGLVSMFDVDAISWCE